MTTQTMPNPLQIRLLGEFQLLWGNKSVAGLNADRPQSLLAYLLLHRHAPQSRQRLAFLLWPDSTESQARTNLRNLLHTLRHTLPQAPDFLTADAMTIQWRPEAPYELDIARFEKALSDAANADDPEAIQDCLETAVSLYQGDLLPGNYDDWIIPLREELRQRYMEALSQLVTLLEEKADYRRAARFCQRLLQLDPFDEAAAVQLMRLQAHSGDRAGIRRSYQALAASLKRELGVEPASTTQAAYGQLIRQEKKQPEDAVAVEEPSCRPRQLPVPPTPFIGREVALTEIAQYLADPDCRLLTIVGLGGMGKTRLALQTAVGHQAIFADGAAFVPLVGLPSASLLAPAIADALQFRFSGSLEPHLQVFNFLSQKEMLLVLDNFEHLLSATANGESNNGEGWVADLLQAAPRLKLIVTSRQRLQLHEEWVYEIEGLTVPPSDALDVAEECSVVTLFEQSARRVNNRFVLTAEERVSVLHICRLVGGMPLGIELAASWVRLLSCAEIAAEIEQSLSFLTGSARNLPERHHSIDAVFDHSWQLLSGEEQAALARLSIFRGGFTREAAEEIAGAGLPLLSALVDKSLVRRSQTSRYDLHELIRQFAAAHLASNARDKQETRERYNDYYLSLLDAQDKALRSNHQKDVLFALTQDIDNLRAAWASAVKREMIPLIRKAADPLWYFYNLRDSLPEGETTFKKAAAMVQTRLARLAQENGRTDHQELEGLLGELLAHQAQFSFRQGRIIEAISIYQSSMALLRPLGETAGLAQALTYSGVVSWIAGEFDAAWTALEESLTILEQLGDPWRQSQSLTFMGMVAFAQGDFVGAYRYLSDSMSLTLALGDPRLLSLVAGQLGRAARPLGRTDEVLDLLHEGLRLATDIGDRLGMGITLEQIAAAAQAKGDMCGAQRMLQESIKQFREIGDMWFLAQALNHEGYMNLATGEYDRARASFKKAGRIAFENQAPPNVLDALIGLATIDAKENRQKRALETVRLVLAHPACHQEVRERAEKLAAELAPNISFGYEAPSNVAECRETTCFSVDDILASYLKDEETGPVEIIALSI